MASLRSSPAYAQLVVASSGAYSFSKESLILLPVSSPLSGLRLRSLHSCGSLPFGGIASLIFGILLIIEPFVGAVVLTLWIGAYALIFGIFLLVLAFRLNS